MKARLITLSLLLVLPFFTEAQNLGDAVRFSNDQTLGTARFVSMGGAFGAIGGDLSSLKVNPAGSSIFMTNRASITLNTRTYNNDVRFNNATKSYRNNNFDLGQGGAIFVFNNTNEAASVNKLSFGITYGKTANYDNRIRGRGQSNTSISDYFLERAQGVPLDLFTPRNDESVSSLYKYLGQGDFSDQGFNNSELQTAYLGYETFLFDAQNPGDLDNTQYTSNVSGDSYDQKYHEYVKGLNGKVSANVSLALNDRFYFGLNLNENFVNYKRRTTFNEFIASPSNINEIYFENTLETYGNGFSFDIGGIAKINDMFRVGVSYKSPTWYNLSDETSQYMDTNSNADGFASVNPRIKNIFVDYNLRTPGRWTGSLAAVFGKSAVVNFGYSIKDFSNMKYSSDGHVDFSVPNSRIDNTLQAASTYRIGGEYRLGHWNLRAGYRYEESPYKDDKVMSELTGYSAGLGYNFNERFRLDFAFDRAERDFIDPVRNSNASNAMRESVFTNYILTLSFAL